MNNFSLSMERGGMKDDGGRLIMMKESFIGVSSERFTSLRALMTLKILFFAINLLILFKNLNNDENSHSFIRFFI